MKYPNLIIRCKFPLAERTTRSIEVKDPNIETEVSQPPIMSPNEPHETSVSGAVGEICGHDKLMIHSLASSKVAYRTKVVLSVSV